MADGLTPNGTPVRTDRLPNQVPNTGGVAPERAGENRAAPPTAPHDRRPGARDGSDFSLRAPCDARYRKGRIQSGPRMPAQAMTEEGLAALSGLCLLVEAGRRQGTGYLVSPELAVTCEHVIRELGAQPAQLRGLTADGSLGPCIEATVVARDAHQDWAILRLRSQVSLVDAPRLGARCPVGAQASALGFPRLAGAALLIAAEIRNPAARTASGARAIQIFSPEIAAGAGALPQGLSGSPVVVDGALVGHLRSILPAPDAALPRAEMGTLYACPLEVLEPHLAALGLQPAAARRIQPQPPGAPYDPAWYIARPEEERTALEHLNHPGAPAVLWAPARYGKTTLLKHLCGHLRADGATHIVQLDLEALDRETRASLSGLLQALCLRMVDALDGDPEWVGEAWAKPWDAKKKASWLLSRRLLPRLSGRLVLALDRVDAAWGCPYQDDFFGLLRAWAEDGSSEPWSHLRLLLALSTTPSQLTEGVQHSPFNLTPPIYLGDFCAEQVRELARERYGLAWTDAEIRALMALVGGHPYLLRLVMFKLRLDPRLELARVLSSSGHELFDSFLNRDRGWLHRQPELLAAARRVHRSPRSEIDLDAWHRLHRAGLLRRDEHGYHLRCPIYARILD